MTADVLDKRLANALVEDATLSIPGPLSDQIPSYAITEKVLDVFKAAYGGLWVGGTARLTRTDLTFQANAMNRAVHRGELDIEVPLHLIEDVEVRKGFATRIIAITVGQRVVKIRCYRADAFAERINAARR